MAALAAAMEEEAALFPDSPENSSPSDGWRLFGRPFFGFAAGDDPAWLSVRKAVGANSWTPLEAFRAGKPGSAATAAELTVAVAVFPQTPETVADQATASGLPGRRWITSRFFHGRAANGLMLRLSARLEALGAECSLPDLAPGFSSGPRPGGISSSWSHRHAAWVAGLGTFGLSGGLITRAGIAHRLGSVVLRARVTPTPRAYAGFRDWCLFFGSGICGKCASRCPAGAIGPKGHDKALCKGFLDSTVKPWAAKRFPDMPGAYGCGLCQSAVPCASRAPLPRT
ncbi:MAG: hypothetical protein LBR80_01960 [Deltaproteobacteria bacterium]|jgi:epoxyqueuosine reductase QueG|nr:hypothetical protein [Deltaproteobacteria bacterium]